MRRLLAAALALALALPAPAGATAFTSELNVRFVGPSGFVDGETGVKIMGGGFGASQGSGSVEICEGAYHASCVSQTVTSWADRQIVFTASQSTLSDGPRYLYVTTDAGRRTDPLGFTVFFVADVTDDADDFDDEDYTTGPPTWTAGGAGTIDQGDLDTSDADSEIELHNKVLDYDDDTSVEDGFAAVTIIPDGSGYSSSDYVSIQARRGVGTYSYVMLYDTDGDGCLDHMLVRDYDGVTTTDTERDALDAKNQFPLTCQESKIGLLFVDDFLGVFIDLGNDGIWDYNLKIDVGNSRSGVIRIAAYDNWIFDDFVLTDFPDPLANITLPSTITQKWRFLGATTMNNDRLAFDMDEDANGGEIAVYGRDGIVKALNGEDGTDAWERYGKDLFFEAHMASGTVSGTKVIAVKGGNSFPFDGGTTSLLKATTGGILNGNWPKNIGDTDYNQTPSQIDDVDDDGDPEVIMAGGYDGPSAFANLGYAVHGQLASYDVATGAKEWETYTDGCGTAPYCGNGTDFTGDSGLQGWYKFGGTGGEADQTANGNDLSETGTVGGATGSYHDSAGAFNGGTARTFDGTYTNNLVIASADMSANFPGKGGGTGGDAFAMGTTIQRDRAGTAEPIMAKWYSPSNAASYKLHFLANNKLEGCISSDGTASFCVQSTTLLNRTDVPYRVSFHSDNTNAWLCINGQAEGTSAYSGGVYNTAGSGFFVGREDTSTTGLDATVGLLFIYNNAIDSDPDVACRGAAERLADGMDGSDLMIDSSAQRPIVADLDGDGIMDIVLGDCDGRGFGNIYEISGEDGSVEAFNQLGYGTACEGPIELVDVDQDGTPDTIIVTTDAYETEDRDDAKLYKLDLDLNIVAVLDGWSSGNSGAFIDTSGDGNVDMCIARYENGRIASVDLTDMSVHWSSNIASKGKGGSAIVAADMLPSESYEIVYPTGDVNNATGWFQYVQILKASDGTYLGSIPFDGQFAPHDLLVADVDGDGLNEIAVNVQNGIFVFDTGEATGDAEWDQWGNTDHTYANLIPAIVPAASFRRINPHINPHINPGIN